MMRKLNYEIKRNGNVWDLHETKTEHVIGSYDSPQSAQVAKTHFNRGGGFDSWTPAFMLQGQNILVNTTKIANSKHK